MRKRLDQNQYTVYGPDEIWKFYQHAAGIYRGGASDSSPKMVKADGTYREADLNIVWDPVSKQQMIHPDNTKGLSFADSIDVLARKKIEGKVWLLPRGAVLPEGLVFNIKDKDHPLLNVSEVMSADELTRRLNALATLMKACDVKIDRSGQIVELKPGALKQAVGT